MLTAYNTSKKNWLKKRIETQRRLLSSISIIHFALNAFPDLTFVVLNEQQTNIKKSFKSFQGHVKGSIRSILKIPKWCLSKIYTLFPDCLLSLE